MREKRGAGREWRGLTFANASSVCSASTCRRADVMSAPPTRAETVGGGKNLNRSVYTMAWTGDNVSHVHAHAAESAGARTKRWAPNCMAQETANAFAAKHARLQPNSSFPWPDTTSSVTAPLSADSEMSTASCATAMTATHQRACVS